MVIFLLKFYGLTWWLLWNKVSSSSHSQEALALTFPLLLFSFLLTNKLSIYLQYNDTSAAVVISLSNLSNTSAFFKSDIVFYPSALTHHIYHLFCTILKHGSNISSTNCNKCIQNTFCITHYLGSYWERKIQRRSLLCIIPHTYTTANVKMWRPHHNAQMKMAILPWTG
jgi:hypothetical protein